MGWWGCAVLGDAEPQMPLSRRAGMRLQAVDGKRGRADPRRQGAVEWPLAGAGEGCCPAPFGAYFSNNSRDLSQS